MPVYPRWGMCERLEKGYGVIITEGFQVERTEPPVTQFILRCREGEFAVEYPIENLMPGSTDVVHVSRIGPWLPPHENEEITDERRREIAARIRDAMGFLWHHGCRRLTCPKEARGGSVTMERLCVRMAASIPTDFTMR